MIFLTPTNGTVIPCGYHNLRGAGWDVTHGTRHVMIMKAAFEWSKSGTDLILSTIDVRPRLEAVFVFVVHGFVWQAEVLTSTSVTVEVAASGKT